MGLFAVPSICWNAIRVTNSTRYKVKLDKSFFCFALLLVVLAAPARADYISPQDVKIKTMDYHPGTTNFEEGTYRYQFSWQGIPVGEAQVDVEDKQIEGRSFLHVKASAQTGKFIDLFYRLRHTSESTFDAQSLKPQRFYSWQKENSREKIREISFDDNGKIRTTGLNNGSVSDQIEFQSDNFTLDPISAAFVARSLPVQEGEELSFDVFSGKHRYLITFHVEGREKLVVGNKTYEAFRVVPSVKKLTDSEGETRLQSATLWVSADPSREVLKLESKVFVGKVSAKLIGFAPTIKEASRQLHARLASQN
jgi:hypothetical protein